MNIVLEIDGVRYKYKKTTNKPSFDVLCETCALKETCGSHYWLPDMCSDLDNQPNGGFGHFIKEYESKKKELK